MRPHQLAMLIALSVIWGSAFMLVKVSLEELPPLTIVAGRLTGGALLLLLMLLAAGGSLPRTWRGWYPLVVLGVANNVYPFILLTWGQQHIESSLAAILTSSLTLSTALMAHYWLKERLTVDRSIGIIVGFAGVAVLIGPDLNDITQSSTLGELAVLAGVLGYSFGTVFARRHLQEIAPTQAAAGQTIIGSTIMIPIALAWDRPFDLDISMKVALAWTTLAVVASGLAYLIYFPLIRQVTATQASLVGYLIPVTAVFLGAIVLDERLGPNSFAGLALIILGVWIVNGGGRSFFARLRSREAIVP